MSEEISDTMNLDLNLGPGPETRLQPIPDEALNLDDWINGSSERIGETASRVRSRQRFRWRQLQIPIPLETQNLSIELNQIIGRPGHEITIHTGEGSIATGDRLNEEPKTCENVIGISDENVSEEKNIKKSSESDGGSFFDCNICLDLAKEPVVTCCGHLFCWSCLYQWLHLHSDAKECPVCKGEVNIKAVTPIYGRGTTRREPEHEEPEAKIPIRPPARRIESLRQTLYRNPFSSHMEEVMRRFRSGFDHGANPVPEFNSNNNNGAEMHELVSSLVNRVLTSRGLRGEQNQVSVPHEAIDLTRNPMNEVETETPRFPRVWVRRHLQPHRGPRISSFSSPSADNYVRDHLYSRNHQEQNPNPHPNSETDSFSSIAAVINSGNQVDTAAEIDSYVDISTSSSIRRNEIGSRVSDLDSADSRTPRRRRLG